MKKNEITKMFVMILVLICAVALTSCFKKDDEEITDVYMDAGVLLMSIDLNSDMDNGNQWELEQEPGIFEYEDIFLEDEGGEEGNNEVQSFTFYPKQSGKAVLKFTNKTTDTVYTYEVTVDEKVENITVDSKKGEAGGAEVEAPDLIIERN